MMVATQKQKIRVEKVERLIVPNVFWRFCQTCQSDQIFVSAEQATVLTKLATRKIFRLVEIEGVHFFETDEGLTHICTKSLMSFIKVENINFVLRGKFLEGDNL